MLINCYVNIKKLLNLFLSFKLADMKKLDFQPYKSKKSFQANYHLHDLAEKHGKNLLIQWGLGYEDFGIDLRNEKVWEKGKDKPDIKIKYKNKFALLDWKGKHNSIWKINKRAFDSYLYLGKKLQLPIIIVFVVFDEKDNLTDLRFSVLNVHQFVQSEKTAWDKNITVVSENDMPLFTKANLIKALEIIPD